MDAIEKDWRGGSRVRELYDTEPCGTEVAQTALCPFGRGGCSQALEQRPFLIRRRVVVKRRRRARKRRRT